MVGFCDLKDLFQPNQFHDSIRQFVSTSSDKTLYTYVTMLYLQNQDLLLFPK